MPATLGKIRQTVQVTMVVQQGAEVGRNPSWQKTTIRSTDVVSPRNLTPRQHASMFARFLASKCTTPLVGHSGLDRLDAHIFHMQVRHFLSNTFSFGVLHWLLKQHNAPIKSRSSLDAPTLHLRCTTSQTQFLFLSNALYCSNHRIEAVR